MVSFFATMKCLDESWQQATTNGVPKIAKMKLAVVFRIARQERERASDAHVSILDARDGVRRSQGFRRGKPGKCVGFDSTATVRAANSLGFSPMLCKRQFTQISKS